MHRLRSGGCKEREEEEIEKAKTCQHGRCAYNLSPRLRYICIGTQRASQGLPLECSL